MNDNLILLIWSTVILIVFAFLWRKGLLARLRLYVLGTREELRKCTWPTWTELKGSTLVVMITILMLGLFTVLIDLVISQVVRWITLA